ncbi:MAG TPA: beta-propeller domain-containing protein [Blastocatellia bacterium]|nr:beta-propeller domain-containing protein [Blastocatellia bacterium]
MKKLLISFASWALIISCLAGCDQRTSANLLPQPNGEPNSSPHKTMRAFHSDREITNYFHELAQKQRRERSRENAVAGAAPEPPSPPATAKPDAASGDKDSITNVQEPGVDEGGIVKVHGDHLVMLRRGRLFTVAIGDGELRPISYVDAFAPDVDPNGTWYDEMLISEDTVVVIGYSYARGGTEVNLFNIDSSGQLSYRSTYHLRSNDYYSSRNYASRLIGNKLIFYTPLYCDPGSQEPFGSFAAVRKWHRGATESEFHRITEAIDVYRPEHPFDPNYGMALHTVTVCDLSDGGFRCKSTSVIGPPGRVFYVSAHAVYVWVTDWAGSWGPSEARRTQSMLYRMPLDGSAPSALGVAGSPVDQFSFLESQDGYINVLVRSDASGDGMWGAETAAGDVALMRARINSFSDGSERAPVSRYRQLPKPDGYTFQNRFVGDYLLYGTGSGWGYPEKPGRSALFAVRWADGQVREVLLNHGTDRIEQMGVDAVVVGANGNDLHFTSVRLAGTPEAVDDYVRKDASQGELRSHGFFYKPEGRNSGMLGLPISTAGRPGYRHLVEGSAAVLFLRNDSLHFREVGELEARGTSGTNDGCRASCVDWYGNARPLFIRGRVIALLGYELVEGSIDRGQMRETRRVNFSPQSWTEGRN